MIIKSIELNNFRVYKGCNHIDLSIGNGKNITIISGQNGYGKTTFLMSLVWCLYGRQMADVDEIYKAEIKSEVNYSQYIRNSLNKRAESEGETGFSVAVAFLHVDSLPGKPRVEIKRMRHIKDSGEPESLAVLIDGDKRDEDELDNETFIRDFIMPIEIAKFFFFDAEKIVSTATLGEVEQGEKLSQSYSEVLGIYKYQRLGDDLAHYRDELKSQTANEAEKAKLERLHTELKIALKQVEELERQLVELKDEASEIDAERKQLLRDLIIAEGPTSKDDYLKWKDEKGKLEESIAELGNELKSRYEKIPFAIAGDLLIEVSEQVARERALTDQRFNEDKIDRISDAFIDELISLPHPADIAIQHRVQDYYIRSIKNLLPKYLGRNSTNHAAIESTEIRHDFSESEKDELNRFIDAIKRDFKDYSSRWDTYRRYKDELNHMKRRIRQWAENAKSAQVQDYIKTKDELERQYSAKWAEIGKKEEQKKNRKDEINQHRKEITEITNRLDVSKDKEKISDLVEQTIKYLKDFIGKFKAAKSHSLSKSIKKSLDELLHKKYLINDVRFKVISKYIRVDLIDSSGRAINKDALSKGEQQIYATALLKGLIDESHIEFPVFVDSPLQKLDTVHADNIMRHFYPTVSKQVVLLPSSTEINTMGDSLSPLIGRTYLIEHEESADGERGHSSFKAVDRIERLSDAFEK
ncbi:MAG: DNA sulfur modification protein DndD [Flavobacteriales bacterium]